MTLIERIARALCVSAGVHPDGLDVGDAAEQLEPAWHAFRTAACDVLRELQNPSDAMADAGAKAAYDRVVDLDASDARTIFAAMIDAALMDGA